MTQKNEFKNIDEFKNKFFPEGFKKELIMRESGQAELTLPEKLLNKIGDKISKV